MANPSPNEATRFPAKYLDASGKSVKTRRIRVPEYLADEIEAIARQMHEERVRKEQSA